MLRKKILLFIAGICLPIFSHAFSPVDSIGVETIKGAKFIRYQVGDGDGWYSIAKKYGISYSELRIANKDRDDKLLKGQVLLIPAKAKPTDPRFQKNFQDKANQTISSNTKNSRVIHKVEKSETLFSISKKYKVTVDQIKEWNKLKDNSIKLGQALIVGIKEPNQKVETVEQPEKKSPEPVKHETPDKTEIGTAPQVIEPKKVETVIVKTVAPEKPKMDPRKEDKKYAFSSGRKEVTEQGVASWIEDEEINPNKYYALHRSAPTGTIIKITNRMNSRSIFVKVVGKLPDSGDNEGLIIKVSKASAEKLGVLDQRFSAELIYGISER